MPYIKKDRREVVDQVVEMMDITEVKANGDLNYILYAYCKRHIEPSYNNFKNFCGELRQCATEIERRLLSELEDQKIKENGDI